MGSQSKHHTVTITKGSTPQADSNTEQVSIFNNATNPRIKNSSFNIIHNSTNAVGGAGFSHNHINSLTKRCGALASPVLDVLYSRVARNAVLNSGGRAEDAKCHPGTRKEVIGIVEQWIDACDGVMLILWLSGPAGAGKTAIMKTIAERSRDRGVHTVNFFFFRGDPTRNHVQPLVATLLYQIFQLYPAAHDAVSAILSINPLILQASMQEQFDELVSPLFDVIHKSSSERTQIILHIDGLDECDIDAKRYQSEILHALHNLATQKGSPFFVLVASRPESHIRMAFNQLSSPVQFIFLDEQYSPQKDIRRFVTAEFRKIKSSHPSAHLLKNDWPTLTDIDAIVKKSSGQFIYAATVMRFLANPSTVPSLSLERVHGIAPPAKNSPFAHLDAMYIYILSVLDDQEATQDILAAREFHERHFNYAEKYSTTTIKKLLRHYNPRYTDMLFESCLSELTAIVQHRDDKLVFYHASLSDFLLDESRSNQFYIDLDAFCAKVFPVMWRRCVGSVSFSQAHPVGFGLLHYVQKPTPAVTDALLAIHPSQLMHNYLVSWDTTSFLLDISRLYYPENVKAYKRIAKKWIIWSLLQDRINIEHFHNFCEPMIKSLNFWSSPDVSAQHEATIAFGRLYLLNAKMHKRLKSLLDTVHM